MLFGGYSSMTLQSHSLEQVKNWVKELKKMLGSDIVLAIVGNKIDLSKDCNVPLETAER